MTTGWGGEVFGLKCSVFGEERGIGWSFFLLRATENRKLNNENALELKPLLGAVFCQSQDFRPRLRHQNGVFELGGEAAIFGPYCPAIVRIDHRMPGAGVDHRFN